MNTVSSVYRHNNLLHPPLGASSSRREQIEWRAPGGEDPRLFQVSRGGEDPMIFPLGAPTRQMSDSLSREEREYLLTHAPDGTMRKFRRGLPEPAVKPIDLSDHL